MPLAKAADDVVPFPALYRTASAVCVSFGSAFMRALHAFERDLRQHRKRVARQYNCKLLLRPDTAVPAIVWVLQ
jgi:hypothetical protein